MKKVKKNGLEQAPVSQSKSKPGQNALRGASFEDKRRQSITQRKLHEGMVSNSVDESTSQLRAAMESKDQSVGNSPKGGGSSNALPGHLKSGIESLSGYSMDDVKVHYNSSKPAQLQAHAYAQGADIHLAPGQEKHLPHEAWHVVQQKQGRVKPTRQLKSKVAINDDAGLEKEADIMGAKAMQLQTKDSSSDKSPSFESGTIPPTVYQREAIDGVNDTELEMEQELAGEVERKPRAILGGRVLLYYPATGPQYREAVIYSHGVYTGEKMRPINGLTLRYLNGHQSILNASINFVNGNFNVNADGGDGNWHIYNLWEETKSPVASETAFAKADESNRVVAVVKRLTRTDHLTRQLSGMGFTQVFGIHCREVKNAANVQIAGDTGQEVDTSSEWPRADFFRNFKIYDASLNDFMGGSRPLVNTDPIQVGMEVYKGKDDTRYRVIQILNGGNRIEVENLD